MNPSTPQKLYLVTREDLPLAQQAVQAAHALTEYLLSHKEGASSWYSTSNTLALLSVPTEDGLSQLVDKARRKGFMFSEFREPDRFQELTAVAFEPKAKPLLRNLPLALRLEYVRNPSQAESLLSQGYVQRGSGRS